MRADNPLSTRTCGASAEPDSCGAMTVKTFFNCLDLIGALNVLSPTHAPPPLSRPAGRKRGASCGRVFKGGKSELIFALTSKWQYLMNQSLGSIAKARSNPDSKARSRRVGDQSRVAIAATLRQRTIQKQISHHQSVGQMWLLAPLSAPAGVERGGGDRGGIPRKKNTTAAEIRASKS